MYKATSIAATAAAALTLSVGAYAQSNNTLATPSTVSPVKASSGYGTPGTTNSDSGQPAASSKSGQSNGTNGSAPATTWKSNNSLATPSVVSPAAAQ
jgi:hypothetical protein